MNQKDNRIVVDLTKVQWAGFGYRNQNGDWRNIIPTAPTVHNQSFHLSENVFSGKVEDGLPTKTMFSYAKDNNLLDIWTPELKLKITANCILIYTGEKTKSLYKAFCDRQFNKKK